MVSTTPVYDEYNGVFQVLRLEQIERLSKTDYREFPSRQINRNTVTDQSIRILMLLERMYKFLQITNMTDEELKTYCHEEHIEEFIIRVKQAYNEMYSRVRVMEFNLWELLRTTPRPSLVRPFTFDD